ncbi:MAG: transcriptional regulator, partial [Actinomycetes bacterium]
RSTGAMGSSSDAELWVSGDAWQAAVDRVTGATVELHRAAVAPHTSGALHVSITTALFEMGDGS